ncbi:MAG: AAA family ATPase [Chromatiales bacterium]|nr:AAA family ATPase [Chromatiales bacterium]
MSTIPFYSNETIEQQLDLIHHMLQFGDELLLVTGEKGVGKSRQLQELMHRLGEGWQICYLSGAKSPQISQLFEQVSQSFGYDYSTTPSAELLAGFQHHLEQRESGKTYTLLIDDAEQLDDATLEAVTHLAQLQNSDGRLLRVALFGNESLSQLPIFKDIPSREVAITPLNGEQIRGYINFCIEQGRHTLGKPPSTALQQQIEKRAGGLPKQIEAMLQGSSQPSIGVKQLLDWRITLVILLLLSVVSGYLLNRGSDEGLSESPLMNKSVVPRLQQPVIRKPVETLADSKVIPAKSPTEAKMVESVAPAEKGESKLLINDLLKQSERLLVDPDPSLTVKSAVEFKKDKMAEGGDIQTPVEEKPAQILSKKLIVPVSPVEAGVASSATTARSISTGEIRGRTWLQQQLPTSFTVQLLAAGREMALNDLITREGLHDNLASFSFMRDGQVIHVLTQGVFSERAAAEVGLKKYSMTVKPWIRPIADIHQLFKENPLSVLKDARVPTGVAAKTLKDTAWLWSQDPEQITIQLMAGHSREMLKPYIKQSLLIGESAILELKRDSKPWFVLLLGHYKSRKLARSAVANLPQSLQQASPWVRSFASVHDELSRSN